MTNTDSASPPDVAIVRTADLDVRRPRGRTYRFLIAGVIWCAVNATWLALRHLVIVPAFGSGVIADFASVLAPTLATLPMCKAAGYRKVDALQWLIPLWGAMLTGRLAWRIAFLPWRDWPLRSIEDNESWLPARDERYPNRPICVQKAPIGRRTGRSIKRSAGID